MPPKRQRIDHVAAVAEMMRFVDEEEEVSDEELEEDDEENDNLDDLYDEEGRYIYFYAIYFFLAS
jgi:hypothetical protein